MAELLWFIAQCAPPGGPGGKGGGTGSFLIQLLPFVLIFVLFYWLVLGPQRKREKEHQRLLNNLKKGDRVITQSGIYGEIFSLTPDNAVLEIAPKVKINIRRNMIAGLEATPNVPQTTSSTTEESSEDRFSKAGKKKKK